MKNLFLTSLFLLSVTLSFTQSVDDYVKEGISYHDKGQYSKAINVYKKALEIEPSSAKVNYEMSLSYFSNGDYQNAIKYADIVLKQKSDYPFPNLQQAQVLPILTHIIPYRIL